MNAVGAAFPDGQVRQPKEFHEDGGDLNGTNGSEPSLPSGTVAGKDKRNSSSERLLEDNQAPGDFEGGADVTWELSKENVMPLARGRKIETIRRAFAGSAAPQGRRRSAEVLSALKRKFEPLIDEAGDGDADELLLLADERSAGAGASDPLALWWEYIQAVQDQLPSDQQEHFELLERCSRKFKDVSRYKQDLRYLRVWIAYASRLRNGEDLFKFLYKKGIGSTLAQFWIAWALHAEKAGKYPLVEKLYVKGIDRRSEPRDLLLQRQKEFLRRMRRQWFNSQEEAGVQDLAEFPRDEETRRGILQTLSTAAVERNQRDQAGNQHLDENGERGLISGTTSNTNGNNGQQSRQRSRRNGINQRGLGGGVVREGGDNVRGGTSSNSSGPGFTVFVEAAFEAGGLARSRRAAQAILEEPQDESSSDWADYGTRKSRNKENNSKPARWTDAALGDGSGEPVSSASTASFVETRRGVRNSTAAPFPIFVDEKPANTASFSRDKKKKPEKGSKKRVLKSLPRASKGDDLKAASGGERATSIDQEDEQVEEARAKYYMKLAIEAQRATGESEDSTTSAEGEVRGFLNTQQAVAKGKFKGTKHGRGATDGGRPEEVSAGNFDGGGFVGKQRRSALEGEEYLGSREGKLAESTSGAADLVEVRCEDVSTRAISRRGFDLRVTTSEEGLRRSSSSSSSSSNHEMASRHKSIGTDNGNSNKPFGSGRGMNDEGRDRRRDVLTRGSCPSDKGSSISENVAISRNKDGASFGNPMEAFQAVGGSNKGRKPVHQRDVPAPSEESITSSGSNKIETSHNGVRVDLVNPREAFIGEGDRGDDGEACRISPPNEQQWQRRLTFGAKGDSNAGGLQGVSGDATTAADKNKGGKEEKEDMTINSRLASSLIDEWLCIPVQPRTAEGKEASGDGVNSQQVQELQTLKLFNRPAETREPSPSPSAVSNDGRTHLKTGQTWGMKTSSAVEGVPKGARKENNDVPYATGDGHDFDGLQLGRGKQGRRQQLKRQQPSLLEDDENVWTREKSLASVKSRTEGVHCENFAPEAVSRGGPRRDVMAPHSFNENAFPRGVGERIKGGDRRRDVPVSEDVSFGESFSSNSISSSCWTARSQNNASGVFVNPREAFIGEGDGDAEGQWESQRRLMFGAGRGGGTEDGSLSQDFAGGDDGDASTVPSLATDVECRYQENVEGQEKEDMTINTKLANELVDEWLCSPEQPRPTIKRKNALEKDGDSEKPAAASDNGDFEVFYDPDGSLGAAALLRRDRERGRLSVGVGNPLGVLREENEFVKCNNGKEFDCGDAMSSGEDNGRRCDGFEGVGREANDEDRENHGCPRNPHARNVRDPGIKVFRELDVGIPPPHSSGEDSDDDSDSSSADHSRTNPENDGIASRSVGRVTVSSVGVRPMVATAAGTATAAEAAAVAAAASDATAPSQDIAENSTTISQQPRHDGSSRRGALGVLNDSRPSRITNGDIIRRFRMAAAASSSSRSEFAPAPGAAVPSSTLSESLPAAGPSSNLGFSVYSDDTDTPTAEKSATLDPTATLGPSRGLGFAVAQDDVAVDEPVTFGAPNADAQEGVSRNFLERSDRVGGALASKRRREYGNSAIDRSHEGVNDQPPTRGQLRSRLAKGSAFNAVGNEGHALSEALGRGQDCLPPKLEISYFVDDENGDGDGDGDGDGNALFGEDDGSVAGLPSISFFDDSPVDSSRTGNKNFGEGSGNLPMGALDLFPSGEVSVDAGDEGDESYDAAQSSSKRIIVGNRSAAAMNPTSVIRRKNHGLMQLELSRIPEAVDVSCDVEARISPIRSGSRCSSSAASVSCYSGGGPNAEESRMETLGAVTAVTPIVAGGGGGDWLAGGMVYDRGASYDAWGGRYSNSEGRGDETDEKRRVLRADAHGNGRRQWGLEESPLFLEERKSTAVKRGSTTTGSEELLLASSGGGKSSLRGCEPGSGIGTINSSSTPGLSLGGERGEIGCGSRFGNRGGSDQRKMSGGRSSLNSLCFSSSSSSSRCSSSPFPLLEGNKPSSGK